jgi:hypothetical protein
MSSSANHDTRLAKQRAEDRKWRRDPSCAVVGDGAGGIEIAALHLADLICNGADFNELSI